MQYNLRRGTKIEVAGYEPYYEGDPNPPHVLYGNHDHNPDINFSVGMTLPQLEALRDSLTAYIVQAKYPVEASAVAALLPHYTEWVSRYGPSHTEAWLLEELRGHPQHTQFVNAVISAYYNQEY